MNLIQAARKRAGREALRRQGHPRFRSRATPCSSTSRSSKASAPACRPMRACASPAPARGLNENFTVRKISYGEGVERVFPLYSPMIDSIKVVRRGKVRRAKLYYLRGLRGKSARITEAPGRSAEARSGGTIGRRYSSERAACRPFFRVSRIRCRDTDWHYPHGFELSGLSCSTTRACRGGFRPADGAYRRDFDRVR